MSGAARYSCVIGALRHLPHRLSKQTLGHCARADAGGSYRSSLLYIANYLTYKHAYATLDEGRVGTKRLLSAQPGILYRLFCRGPGAPWGTGAHVSLALTLITRARHWFDCVPDAGSALRRPLVSAAEGVSGAIVSSHWFLDRDGRGGAITAAIPIGFIIGDHRRQSAAGPMVRSGRLALALFARRRAGDFRNGTLFFRRTGQEKALAHARRATDQHYSRRSG